MQRSALKMVSLGSRAELLARIDGLVSELQRLGLYMDDLTIWERESYRVALRAITQWTSRVNNDTTSK
jgi:hypothetical protein